MTVGLDKEQNLDHAVDLIRRTVAKDHPRVVALPECFNSPYSTSEFAKNAEIIPDGPSCRRLSAIAKESNVCLIGGTIPERDAVTNKIHNTCTIWSPTGDFLGKYRKVTDWLWLFHRWSCKLTIFSFKMQIHLFDMDVEASEHGDAVKFKESDVFTPGDSLTILDVEGFKIGICICFDIRFEELGRIYRKNGMCDALMWYWVIEYDLNCLTDVDMLIYPAAFDLTTGPMQWEVLQRGRANDLQVYVATVSSARVYDAEYVSYGHSMVVDPWAQVAVEAGEGEQTIVWDLDPEVVRQARDQIPIGKRRRLDLYDTVSKFKAEPRICK